MITRSIPAYVPTPFHVKGTVVRLICGTIIYIQIAVSKTEARIIAWPVHWTELISLRKGFLGGQSPELAPNNPHTRCNAVQRRTRATGAGD